ncbi:LysR substrate-binding domain-containing protein [Pseudomonas resinovorans]|uniref:LysR substrate-binding domain-containing protein n=1 Tax=Metapseudomonas resinovorans TaxID=53412 RepID=A0ABT4Y5N9_METRE|nr:LysR substrate-binding domain-containing protein [Pseudomonas resinovorans]MDA8484154.1 LysR substrate-binding domain-containing protein [Pseudomonas resinovorans]
MQDLNDLFYFAKVVEYGGFSAAARLLGVPKSRLSRRIAELETRLDARLLQRTTRKMALTDVGERFLRHCQAMLLEAEQAEEVVASLTVEPRGRLRVSCPTELAHAMLRPMITDFLQQYPLVQLDMILTNRRVDLREEGVDVALRVREEGDEDPTLIARVLRPAQAFLVAAPSLVEGRSILTPDDLQSLPALGGLEADRRIHHDLRDAQGNRREVVLEARLGIEDFDVRKHAVLAGLGFSMLPQMNCEAELRDGSMVRLLPDWHLPGGNLQAVYTHRRGMLPAVRAWIEHLSQAMSHPGMPII